MSSAKSCSNFSNDSRHTGMEMLNSMILELERIQQSVKENAASQSGEAVLQTNLSLVRANNRLASVEGTVTVIDQWISELERATGAH